VVAVIARNRFGERRSNVALLMLEHVGTFFSCSEKDARNIPDIGHDRSDLGKDLFRGVASSREFGERF